MMIQNIIALFIVFLAVSYAVWQVVVFFKNAGNMKKGCGCSGCGFAEKNKVLQKIKTKK